MADLKISQLIGATTPLVGTEVVPLVQSGATKNVTVSNLTSGRAVPMNAVVFPATQSPIADPNTLDDYEEGNWTATLGGFVSDPSTPVTATGHYTKIGRQVTATVIFLNVSTVGGSGAVLIRGLPFTPGSDAIGAIVLSGFGNAPAVSYVISGRTTFEVYNAISQSNISIDPGINRFLATTVSYFV